MKSQLKINSMKKSIIVSFIIVTLFACNNSSKENSLTSAISKAPNVKQVSFSYNSNKKYNPKILPYLEMMYDELNSGALTSYDWQNNRSCNVGLMAQFVTGMSGKEIDSCLKSMKDYRQYADDRKKEHENFSAGAWSCMVNYYCGVTGKRVDNLIGDLQKSGFSAEDICTLEYLSDANILKYTDMDKEGAYFARKENLIKYLHAWIEIIKQQNANL